MPLLKCPDCNNDVSSNAKSCPHCGCPMQPESAQPQRPKTAKPKRTQGGGALFIAAICLGVIGLFVWPLLIVAGILLFCALFATNLECGACGTKLQPRQKVCSVCKAYISTPRSSLAAMLFLVIIGFIALMIILASSGYIKY